MNRYEAKQAARRERLQAAARAVGANGHVYLEAPRAWVDAELAALGLVVKRHLKAGAVHAHWLRPSAVG